MCVHAHSYRRPRENPWLETVEVQESAAPHHYGNERAKHPGSALADLYDPLSMPRSHRAVDAAYRRTSFAGEAERVAFLFARYEKLTSLFPSEPAPRRPRRKPRAA